MRNAILTGQTLKTIENNIQAEVARRQCEFWGDLELSFDEMEVLRERLSSIISVSEDPVKKICKVYPHSITTFMVFFVRYKYNLNFWGVLGDELGIELSINQHAEIGNCAKKMFAHYKMDISDTRDEPHQNIAPIIYEACLPPESSLDDLFYIMNYDTYKEFDPQLIIDDLIDMRSYKIRKTLKDFLKRFKDDRAIDFILEVRDAMLHTDQGNATNSRYIGNYVEWNKKEKSKTVITDKKDQQFQTRPYLFFDNGNKGLCIILPRTVLSTEWIEEVVWTIKGSDGFSKTIGCRVMGDDGKRYTDAIAVPVSPSERYFICLFDADGLDDVSDHVWEIDGICRDKAVFFNCHGRQVNANYLPSPFCIMVFPKGVQIINSNAVDIFEQYYPTMTSGYRTVSVSPQGDEASLTYWAGLKPYTISCRPQINMALEGKTLFSLDKINIFTKLPTLHLSVIGSIFVGGIELRIGDKAYPIKLNVEEETIIDLAKLASSRIKQYGTYSVRLYQMGRFIKQIEFSYVPNIKSDYSPLVFWQDKTHRRDKISFRFGMIDEWEMEFDRCTVSRDEKCYTIEVPSNVGVVPIVLKSRKDSFVFKCGLNLPIRPFEAEILDGEGEQIENTTDKTYKVGVDWFLDNEKWLSLRTYGNYLHDSYHIRLISANGIEQNEHIHMTQNGAGNIDLSVFNDTLISCPLPAEIEIVCGIDEEKAASIIIVTEKMTMEAPVKYCIKKSKSYVLLNNLDDGKDIDVVRFGYSYGRRKIHIPYSESVLSNSGMNRGYIYPGELKEGIYVVSGSVEESLFEFEDDDTVELKQGNNVFLVSNRNQQTPITDISTWLDLLVSDVLHTKPTVDLSKYNAFKILESTKELNDLDGIPFNTCDIEKLVALAYLTSGKIVKTKKDQIRKCMRLISSKFMQRGDRYRIIELLVDLDAPQEVFDICFVEYALLLFYADKLSSQTLANKTEKYSIELSMLLMMSSDGRIRDCVWREKYRDLIGKDAIKRLLSVPGESDSEVIVEEQKKYLREIKGSKVRINLDDEIVGNQESIVGMVVYDTKHPVLDITKKPEYGVYFAGIKYVDQYVNWYKINHDKMGNMNPEKRSLMKEVVLLYENEIENAFVKLKKDKHISNMTMQYMNALDSRYKDRSTSFSYQKYFYLQGLAAFLAKLPVFREDLDGIRNTGIQFMETAYIVAPRLSKRDILMAETYRYLKMKEEMLCQ